MNVIFLTPGAAFLQTAAWQDLATLACGPSSISEFPADLVTNNNAASSDEDEDILASGQTQPAQAQR